MTLSKENIKKLAQAACRSLYTGTPWAYNRKLITRLFERPARDEYDRVIRLTVIDSLYSTNVNSRRLFGIEDIAKELMPSSDAELKQLAHDYVKSGFDRGNRLYAIFVKLYGTDKKGGDGKAAASLLSKYLYFLTGYQFPVYDELGSKQIAKLFAAKTPRKPTLAKFEKRFQLLSQINAKSAINSFDVLDSLLWLCGKTGKGSYSLVLNRRRYQKLARYPEIPETKDIDNAFAAKIAAGITRQDPELKNILGAALFQFLRLKKEYEL